MEYILNTLNNGLRTVFKPAGTESKVSHCCLIIQKGSRDELNLQCGMAHFTEHMIFKGTKKRNSVQILRRLENGGGDLNAFTTNEYTCIQASFLSEHVHQALELIADMAFNSIFPEDELELERGVILDEIDSYQDIPEEQVFDEFDELLFPNHPLGKPVLGKKETVSAFTRDDMLDFFNMHYVPGNMILGFNGPVPIRYFNYYAKKYFEPAEQKKSAELIPAPIINDSFLKRIQKPINQVHGIIGGRSVSSLHPNRTTMLLLNHILSGGMSSRLNLEIREKRGICYTIDSSYTGYSDTGIFSVYFGTEASKAEKCLHLIKKELNLLRNKSLGTLQLQQAKQRFKGQIALAEEHRVSLLLGICKSIADFGKADSLTELLAKIDGVNSSDILELANYQFEPSHMGTLLLEPFN